MFALLQRWIGPPESTLSQRRPLTPGRLFARMSADLKAQRGGLCGCTMPLPYSCEPALPGECNWRLQWLRDSCAPCELAIAEIFRRYSSLYDLREPRCLAEQDR